MSRKNLVVVEKHMESLVFGSPCTEVTLNPGQVDGLGGSGLEAESEGWWGWGSYQGQGQPQAWEDLTSQPSVRVAG